MIPARKIYYSADRQHAIRVWDAEGASGDLHWDVLDADAVPIGASKKPARGLVAVVKAAEVVIAEHRAEVGG